jgi:hypothetical protein
LEVLVKKSELVGLRGKIAEFAAAGRAIRLKIQAAFARAKYDLWNDKRAVGVDARHALLAYAYLRGIPYRIAEPTAGTPQGRTEESCRKELAGEIACAAQQTPPAVVADIAAWLAVPEQTDRKARRLAAEQAGRERRQANRARYADCRTRVSA